MKAGQTVTWKQGTHQFKAECIAVSNANYWLRLIEPEHVSGRYTTMSGDDCQKAQVAVLPDFLEQGLNLLEFNPVADMNTPGPGNDDGGQMTPDEIAVLLQQFA